MVQKFNISDQCPPEQRKLFEALNGVLDKLGITADEFDTNFRAQMMNVSNLVSMSAQTSFFKGLTERVQQELIKATPSLAGNLSWHKEAEGNLTPQGMMEVKTLPFAFNTKTADDALRTIGDNMPSIFAKITEGLNQKFGRFQDVNPDSLSATDKKIYANFQQFATGSHKAANVKKKHPNLLQTFADGKPFIDGKGEYASWQFPSVELETGEFTGYAIHALRNTITFSAKSMGWSNERIQAELGPDAQKLTDAALDMITKPDVKAAAPANEKPEPIDYYLRPKDQYWKTAPMAENAKELSLPVPNHSGELFLTPACINRAKKTGEYKFLTASEVIQDCKENASADSPSGIRHLMFSLGFGGRLDKKTFEDELVETITHATLRSAPWALEDGRQLDVNRYAQEAVADSDKWVAAFNKQAQDIQKKHDDSKGKKVAKYFADGALKRFLGNYKKFDDAAQALISYADVKILVDGFNEVKGAHTNINSGIIVVSPEFLTKPHAMELIRNQAVDCAMARLGIKANKNWDLAREEFETSDHTKFPAAWKTTGANNVVHARDVLAIARRDPKKLRELLPMAYLADYQQELQVKQEAHRIITGEAAPQLGATDKAFTINAEILTAPQQAMFSKVNKLIAELGVTPKEFDTQFRASALIAYAECMKETATQLKDQTGLTIDKVVKDADMLPAEQMFGMHNAGLPVKADATERRNAEQVARNIGRPISHDVPQEENLLQSYAAGTRPMALLASMPLAKKINATGAIHLDMVFDAAMSHAVSALQKKMAPDNTALSAEIDEFKKSIDNPGLYRWADGSGKQTTVRASRGFSISDACPPEQRKLFEQINRALGELGVSADEFDARFRVQLLQASVLVPQSAETSLVVGLDEKRRRQLIQAEPRAAKCVEWHKTFTNALTSHAVMEIKHTDPNLDPAALSGIMDQMRRAERDMATQFAGQLNEKYGRFQDVDTSLLSTDEKKAYQMFIDRTSSSVHPSNSAQKTNFLQGFANGKTLFDKQGNYSHWDLPGVKLETAIYDDYMINAMVRSFGAFAKEKGINQKDYERKFGGLINSVINTADEMIGANRPAAGNAPVMQPNLNDEAKRQAMEAARLEAERLRKEEEAAKPVSYVLANGALSTADRIQRHGSQDWKHLQGNALTERKPVILAKHDLDSEIKGLQPLFNTKLPMHKDVADVLLGESTLRRAEYASEPAPQGKDKTPRHVDGFAGQATRTLAVFFNQSQEGLSDAQQENNRQIRDRILQSPTLVIAALGDDKQLKELREIQTQLHIDRPPLEQPVVQQELRAKRDKLAHDLLTKAGIDISKVAPLIPATEELPHSEPAPAAPVVPVPDPVAPIVAAASVIPAVIAEQPAALPPAPPEPPKEQAVVFESVTAANGGLHTTQPKITSGSKPPEPSAAPPVFEDDPGNQRRKLAFEQSIKSLLADTEQHTSVAKEKGFNHFECRLDVDNDRLPIQLTFSKRYQDEDGKVRTKRMTETLSSHSGVYKQHKVPLTLGDAVDLKIAVQSKVFNTSGKDSGSEFYFEPPPFAHKPGVVDVSYGAELPAATYDRTQHMAPGAHIVERSGGVCALEINVQNPYRIQHAGKEPDVLRVSFPLGIARKPGTPAEQQATEHEITLRKSKTLELLQEVQQQRQQQGQRISVTKGDIVHKLQSWVSAQGKKWEAPQHIPLEGFEDPQLLFVGKGDKPQKVRLAPVMLEHEVGGENPSWLMRLNFHINSDGTDTLGDLARSRTVRLHTDNHALAVRRATESLVGVKTKGGNQLVDGLLPSMQTDMAKSVVENPNVRWSAEGDTLRDKVMIGTKPLQHMLDDMMRYEHDIGIKARYDEQKSALELTAIRSLTGDYGGKVSPTPETLNLGGNPVRVTVPVPAGKEDKIAAFVEAVHEDIRWHTAEHYASVAITGDKKGGILGPHTEEEDRRKRPAGYKPATAKNALITSVSAKYKEIFGRPLPAGWPDDDTRWTGKTSPRPGTSPSELGA